MLKDKLPFSKRTALLSAFLFAALPALLAVTLYFNQDIREKAAEPVAPVVSPTPAYAPGEVIVKFKVDPLSTSVLGISSDGEVKGVQDVRTKLDTQDVAFQEVQAVLPPTSSSPLTQINTQYKIKTLSKVFKGSETPDRELTKFKTKFAADIAAGRRKINEAEFLKTDLSKTYKLTLEQNQDPLTVSKTLSLDPNVAYAEPNYYGYPAYDPDDPAYVSGQQWALAKVQASQAWDTVKGDGVVVAVLDTGFGITHPDLAANLLPGYNFTSTPENTDVSDHPTQPCGHGTHVAGIVSAVANNNIGIAGLAFNAKILPVKIIDRYYVGNSCYGSYADFASGVRYAADHQADVVNMSFGGTARSDNLNEALAYGANLGLVFVAAAGNNNVSVPFYPAFNDHVIAVAGTDSNDNRYAYSNYGAWVDIAAPAVSIYSLYTNNSYIALSGTSMAAPHVSALAALILSKRPDLRGQPQLVKNIINNSADDLGDSGYDIYFGIGRINAYRAVTELNSSSMLPYWFSMGINGVPAGTWDTAEEILQHLTANGYQALEIDRYNGTSWEPHTINSMVNNFPIQLGEGYLIKIFGEAQDSWKTALSNSVAINSITYNINSGLNIISIPENYIQHQKNTTGSFTTQELCQIISSQTHPSLLRIGKFMEPSLVFNNSEADQFCGDPDDGRDLESGKAYRMLAIAPTTNTFTLQIPPPTAVIQVPGKVSLESRPTPPHASWVTSMVGKIYSTNNNLLFTQNTETDNRGYFDLTPDIPADLPSEGVYTVAVKGSHSLSRKQAVMIDSGSFQNSTDFGTLFEGDANGDDVVNDSDTTILIASYNKSTGQTGFNPLADFTNDGTVNVNDYNLLVANYFKYGENKSPTPTPLPTCFRCDVDNNRCFSQTDSTTLASCISTPTAQPYCPKFDANQDKVVNAADISWCAINCACPTIAPTSTPIPVTTTFKVNTASNDHYQISGTNNQFTDQVYVGKNGTTSYTSAFRFTNITIPKGRTIRSAYLKLSSNYYMAGSNTNRSGSIKVYGEKVVNSTAPNTGTISSRPVTTTNTTWTLMTSADTWATRTYKQSPTIATIIQELVNQSTWNTNNSLTLILKDGTTGYWSTNSFETQPAYGAELVVTY